ncbi:hypothetical protein GCM10010421_49040 [Streptomyces glaucus]|uniref:Secreted protein n=1 Tax=Streptomyces glaucus TaxID=284029 RepID=A0ABN3K696_9ACTN
MPTARSSGAAGDRHIRRTTHADGVPRGSVIRQKHDGPGRGEPTTRSRTRRAPHPEGAPERRERTTTRTPDSPPAAAPARRSVPAPPIAAGAGTGARAAAEGPRPPHVMPVHQSND